jgi:hypothetical protein
VEQACYQPWDTRLVTRVALAGPTLAIGVAAASAIGQAAGQAGGQGVSISVSASRDTLHYPDQRTFTLRMGISTRDQPANVIVREGTTNWPDRDVAGGPIRLEQPSLQGPGHLTVGIAIPDYPPGVCLRGVSGTSVDSFEVDLPAHLSTTVVQGVVATRRPPWPGTDYTPRLTLQSEQPVPIAVPHIRMTGKRGVHIRLRTDPRLSRVEHAPNLRGSAPAGRPLTVLGRTSPVVAHGLVSLQAISGVGRHRRTHPLGGVRTDSHGWFRTKPWLPRENDTYQVRARYRGPKRGLVADGSCGLSFTVGGEDRVSRSTGSRR